jgi:hypothetical protein
MNHLQTIPALSPAAAITTAALSPSWQARAHRSIRSAMERGTLPLHQVKQACGHGERAIAALMVERCAIPALPTVPLNSVKTIMARSANTKSLRAIAGFVRAMKAAGLVGDKDAPRASRNPLEAALDLFQSGLERMHARAEGQLPKLQSKRDKGLYRPFAIEFPQLELGSAMQYYRRTDQDDGIEDDYTLALYVTDTPLCAEPRLQDQDDIAALRGALGQVSRASKLGLFVKPEHAVEALCAYQFELIQDIATHSTWSTDGNLVCGDHAHELLESELGTEAASEDGLAYIADAVRFVQAPRQKPWAIRSRQLVAWRAARRDSGLGKLVEDLLAIARKLESLPPLGAGIEYEAEGDVAAILVLPTNPAPPEFLEQGFDHYGESGESIVINFSCGPGNQAQLLQLYERVLIEVSLVTAAMNILVAYE